MQYLFFTIQHVPTVPHSRSTTITHLPQHSLHLRSADAPKETDWLLGRFSMACHLPLLREGFKKVLPQISHVIFKRVRYLDHPCQNRRAYRRRRRSRPYSASSLPSRRHHRPKNKTVLRQRYGSSSGSFHHQARIVRKTLIVTVFVTPLWLFPFDEWCKRIFKSNNQNKYKFFFGVLKVTNENSRIRSQIR